MGKVTTKRNSTGFPSVVRSCKLSISGLIEFAFWAAGISCIAIALSVGVTAVRAQQRAISFAEDNWFQNQLAEPDFSQWSASRKSAYIAADGKIPHVPLGILTVSSANVRIAVFDGISDSTLNIGAGRIPGTASIYGEGNLAIAAHRDGFFRGLKDVSVGDEITIRHEYGLDRYVVSQLRIVQPDDVSVLAPTDEPALTLVTCYPFYFVGSAPQRYIVRAKAQ